MDSESSWSDRRTWRTGCDTQTKPRTCTVWKYNHPFAGAHLGACAEVEVSLLLFGMRLTFSLQQRASRRDAQICSSGCGGMGTYPVDNESPAGLL